MIRAALIFAFMVWPLASVSAQVDVRTGEHADFTRIVLTIPEGSEWRLGRRSAGYVLRLAGVQRYELSGFFDLIPRQRITAISQVTTEGELLIDVDCVCNAQGFLFRPNTLVIDIRDGPPALTSPFESALSAPPVDELADQETRYQVSQNRLIPLVTSRTSWAVMPETVALADGIANRPIRPRVLDQDVNDAIIALETSIATGMGSALTDGLLEGNLSNVTPRTDTMAQRVQLIVGSQPGFPGLAARSSVDPNAVSEARGPEQTQTGEACLPDAYFDVEAWGDESPFFDQLQLARRALVPEFEQIVEEAVTQLARLYVRFGFGREAIQTLSLDQVRSQERQYLEAMARLVDGRQPDDDLFSGQVSCPSFVALWAVLATSTLPFDAKVDSSAVLTTFRSLPEPLQTIFSVPLSQKLLAVGNTDAALQVLGTAENGNVVAAERVLASAALLDALGESDQATQTVLHAARNDPRVSSELMLRFFEDGIEAGLDFSDADFLSADALFLKQSDGPFGGQLAGTQIKAYISVGRFADAIDLLAETGRQLGPEHEDGLRNHIYEAAVVGMDDIEFLRFVLTDENHKLAQPVRSAIAERLISMGFPIRAQEILKDSTEAQQQLYDLAVSNTSIGEPETDLQNLVVQSTTRAQQISEQMQATDIAVARLPTDAIDANPDIIEDSRGERFQQIAAQIDQNWQDPLDFEMPLTSSRALLERSTKSRAILADLLQTFEAPSDF